VSEKESKPKRKIVRQREKGKKIYKESDRQSEVPKFKLLFVSFWLK
jgi:hypothetical protein